MAYAKEVPTDKVALVAMREEVTPRFVRLIASGERKGLRGKGKSVAAALCQFDQMAADFLSKKPVQA